MPDALRVGAESELLLAACPPANYVIALDIKGKEITSEGFAELMAARMLYGQPVTFLIGGAHGFADSIRKRADLLISFGRCTWPHMLVRVMLMEQLYRAYSIQHNHPYHK